MLKWDEYKGHKSDIQGARKKFDNTIYTFDIETSSYIKINDKILPAIEYENISDEYKDDIEYFSSMYIWQFSINDTVYYGRTWSEFRQFLNKLEANTKELKYIYVHNLAFEFQYLKSYFSFCDVMARKAHKVMSARMRDYNIIFRCSYMLSNCALKYLPDLYQLDVQKDVGDLDYDLIRTSDTPLSNQELKYCEDDCLVVYKYIKRELETYGTIKNIPSTSTGKVRRELRERIQDNYRYKHNVMEASNSDPHIYNMLQDAFAGGYTHANYYYTDEVIKNVISFDETSAYPYVMVTEGYPAKEFQKCNIKSYEEMSNKFCYLVKVKFKNIKSKYENNFISASKCENIVNGHYDNGRIIYADEIIITLTDVDFKLILDTYTGRYTIMECYYALKRYLPIEYIKFILEKYVNKTQYKNVPGKELEYQKEKSKFNALYGMSVTNTIRDEVIYDDIGKMWEEVELSNAEIVDKLKKEKEKGFLSFAYGVWVTAYARNNLIRRIIALDEDVIYCDTDSIKMRKSGNTDIFTEYNKTVIEKLEKTASTLHIPVENFMPKDVKGIKHPLGVFEVDAEYKEFITQGAKKYAYKDDEDEIHITVAGVPKSGSKVLNNLSEFKDNLVFPHNLTNKNIIMYVDNEEDVDVVDYLGNASHVTDKSGCCVLPTTYILGKSQEYSELVTDASSKRARYKE